MMRISNFGLRPAFAITALAALPLSGLAQTPLNPTSVVIDFDYDAQGFDLPAPGFFIDSSPLTSLYAPMGVLFSGPQAGTGGAIVNRKQGGFTVPTRSGANFLAFSSDKYAHGPETITFTGGATSVTIYAIAPGTSSFTLTAYNSLGVPLTATTVLATENVNNNFVFNYYPLTVTTSAALPIDHVILTQQSINPPQNMIYEYDDLSFTPAALPSPSAVVRARILLEGVQDLTQLSAAAPVGNLMVSLRTPGTDSDHYIYSVPLTPVGSGSPYGAIAINAPYGTYDLAIKSAKSLRTTITHLVINGPVTLPDVTLRAGDSNNDNSVDSTDFGALIGAFNSNSAINRSGYDPTADFNYDGFVDSTDFGLLIGEFNNDGDL